MNETFTFHQAGKMKEAKADVYNQMGIIHQKLES